MSSHRALHDLFRAPFLMADPGTGNTITVDRDCAVIPLVSAAGTRTLAQPTKAGLRCMITVDTYTSACTLTVTGGYNQAATTDIIFSTAADWVRFVSIKVGASYYWRILAEEGTDATRTTTTALAATNATVSNIGSIAYPRFTGVAAVTAAGTVIGNAAALSAGINVVANTNNANAVILPVAAAGMVVIVCGTVANTTLPVFPQVNSAIGALTANAACTLDTRLSGPAGIFVATNTTQWQNVCGDIS
jgi:hypothetical protein